MITPSSIIVFTALVTVFMLLANGLRNNQLPPNMTVCYCTHCGNQLPVGAYACTQCGFVPRTKRNFCYNCGTATAPEQMMCTQCGWARTANEGRLPAKLFVIIQRLLPPNIKRSAVHYCTHCGNALSGGEFACPKCGFDPQAKRNSVITALQQPPLNK